MTRVTETLIEEKTATGSRMGSGMDNSEERVQGRRQNGDSDPESDDAVSSFLPDVARRTRATSVSKVLSPIGIPFASRLPMHGDRQSPAIDEREGSNKSPQPGEATKIASTVKPRCPSCHREFAGLAGLKYHVDKRVCDRDVKSLGNKAKQSLIDIQSRRPVIRRVDVSAVPIKNDASLSSSTPSSATKRRKRPITLPRKTSGGVSDQEVDRWVPDTSLLPVCTKEMRSSIVQLHGLPVGTTPDHIVDFFSGLNPDKIWLLPPILAHITSLDANHSILRKKGLHIERLCPKTRVLVKFCDAPAAELAACRSGELLHIRSEHLIEPERELEMTGSSTIGVPIVVTIWNKSMASYFIRNHLYIEGTRNVPLAVTLDATVASLAQTAVLEIISSTVIRDLKLSLTAETCLKNRPLSEDLGQCPTIFGEPQYLKAVEKQGQLFSAYNDLLAIQQCPLDPSLRYSDTNYRLTTSALEFLKRDLGHLDQRLLQARRWKMLQQPSFRIRPNSVDH